MFGEESTWWWQKPTGKGRKQGWAGEWTHVTELLEWQLREAEI